MAYASEARIHGCNHGEAFCLMKYRSDDGEEEILWNSRDGVTPFIITSRSGKRMQHVDWQNDVFAPHWRPAAGTRYFVDATRELVTPELKKYVEKIFTEHGGGYWDTREAAFEALLPSWLHNGEAPWIVTAE
jgi:hypothetical protein